MICDATTCCKGYESSEEDHVYVEDFIKNVRHEKCRVIQLVRRQINKFNDSQFDSMTFQLNFQNNRKNQGAQVNTYGSLEETIIMPHKVSDTSTPVSVESPRFARRFVNVCRRIFTILLIIIFIAFALWMYGGYRRLYICLNGQTGVTSFQYSYAKRALF